jgi:hypothetical protein
MSYLSGVAAPIPVDAAGIVGTRFTEMETFVDDAYAQLEDAINDLANYDPGWSTINPTAFEVDIDELSGNYAFPDIPSPPNIEANFPSAPDRPVLGEIPNLSLPDTPDADIPTFEDGFGYNQTRYVRDGLTTFRARLVDFIDNGGTGIAAAVEQAIYARDKARREIDHEKAFEDVQNFFESRGNTMPSGNHRAAVDRMVIEQQRVYQEISRDVMIKAAELEQENMRIAQDTLVRVDTILVGLHGSEEDRELEAEKTRINAAIAIYEAYVRGVIARLEAHKLTVDSIVAYINANVAVIEANSRVYQADVGAYAAQVDAEAKRLSATADVFRSNVSGIEAAIRGISALADVDIAKYKVESDVAIANANNALKAAQSNLESKMKRIDSRIEAMKSVTTVSAQVVASALNSVTTSASIGQSTSSSFSHAYDEVKDVDSGDTTQHIFQEITNL